jgi:dienelactone hydrolase
MMRSSCLVLALFLVACDPPSPSMDGGTDAGQPSSTRLIFAPTMGAMDFGAVPFPDDLYLDATGHVELGALPSEASAFGDYITTARSAALELDGFGAVSPILFPVDGDIDPSTLPPTPRDSVAVGASVFLVDADPGSPTAFDRIPVDVRWNAATHMLGLRPWEGHALRAGRMYAAVVTRAVEGADNLPLSPADDFRTVRDATTRPADPALAEAWERYQSVLPSLTGVAPSDVVGLAVFHVQTVEPGLVDARAIVRSLAAPTIRIDRALSGAALDALLGTPTEDVPGTDVEGGVQHSHIGWVIDGRFGSPNFLNETPYVHGAFTRDASGDLIVRRTDDVFFTLALPAGDVSAVRAVVYQHGLGAERSAVFSVADALCAQGWAVLAIDIPFHGMRAQIDDRALLDLTHVFGDETGGDGFGDLTGGAVYIAFVGASDTAGPLSAFHPFYVRDVLRQSVVDLMSLVRVIDDGDWSVVEASGGPTNLGFADAEVGFVGVSLGGIVGTTFITMEPRVGAAVMNVTGGALTHIVAGSPSFRGTFLPLVAPRIGLDLGTLDDRVLPATFSAELALYQMLLDGGDSMTFGPILGERPTNVLFQLAVEDETLPNSATEGLARSARAAIAGSAARYSDLAMVGLPLSANLRVGGAMVTRGLVAFEPATHGLLSQRSDLQTVVHPVMPPFEPLATPVPVANDVDGAVGQAVRFFESWRSGTATIEAP